MFSDTSADLQRRFNQLLDHLPAGVVVHRVDGRVLSINKRALDLLGRPKENLIGMPSRVAAWSFVRADNTAMPLHEYPVSKVLRSGNSVSDLVVGVPATPKEPARWLICNAYPEFDGEKRIQRIVVCFTDCTTLKRAERKLHKSTERLRLVLQGSTDAPWDWDLVSREVYYSERWWNMLGYRPGELQNDITAWTTLLHPNDRSRARTFLRNLLTNRDESFSIELPMRHRDGRNVPILSRCFVSRNEAGKALRVSGTNTDLTEIKQAEERIFELAYYDQLTGLPNRRFLTEELNKAIARSERSGQLGALLFLDLDNFKLLNDTMGHEVGDRLLQEVSQRLQSALRHSDQLARLGGDDFALVFEGLGSTVSEAVAEANHVIEKVLAMLNQPFHLSDRVFSSTSCIGVTLFDGMKTDIDALLKQADLAMYRAKSNGRHVARFFDSTMQDAADNQAALESGLRDGIALHEFVLFCQPQFGINGHLTGAEVLVRWRQKDGKMVGPDEFIGLAETSGLIVPLGQHILEESCRALARWEKDKRLCKLSLAVNVSVHQLRDTEFPVDLASILAESGAPAAKLCLELTESVFADDTLDLAQMMNQLCELGLYFSLDDFGTGYSSLGYLKHFPFTELKIDRSFVHDVHIDPSAGPIVKAIIALARQLKLEIVAEGIENEAQRRFLIRGGCNAFQGYLLGPPVPIEDFEHMYGAADVGHG